MDAWLLTGATGFIGHYLLAELLKRRRRCAVLLRPPLDRSRKKLAGLLAHLGLDLDAETAAERFVALPGDLTTGFAWPSRASLTIGGIVHVAAATRFTADPATGEPWKTNVSGTQMLLEQAQAAGVREVHLVSSAYACGRAVGIVPERLVPVHGDFHNDYERSKRVAEQLCAEWACGDAPGRRRLTVFRPSIVVGDYSTGRSTRFNGFYLLARATELLRRSLDHAGPSDQHAVELRINGRPNDRQNIVPVDYVASAMAAAICSPAHHGAVYHLTHPLPPTNQQIKRALELYFDIGGGRFVDPREFAQLELNDRERLFYDVSRPIEHYFCDTPQFDRTRAEALERDLGVAPPPAYDAAAIARLVRYAEQAAWGRKHGEPPAHQELPLCAAYFETFLPRHVGRSRVARMTGLSATVRFVIEDEANGHWVCRFDDGQLTRVDRGSAGGEATVGEEDFAYRSNRVSFWKAISGRVHPQELFLNGHAEITGNVEQALKMAMVLHAFTQEFPCDCDALMRQRQTPAEPESRPSCATTAM